jgi:hypothetical protein
VYKLDIRPLVGSLEVSILEATYQVKFGIGDNSHIGYQSLHFMSSHSMVMGIPIVHKINEVCQECQLGKQVGKRFLKESISFTKVPIHFELCIPLLINSLMDCFT